MIKELQEIIGDLSFVPCYKGTKLPAITGWADRGLALHEIDTSKNVAVKLGGPHYLVDLDIETPELARFLQPAIPTTYAFGRESNQIQTHYLYYTNGTNKPVQKFKGKDNSLSLELRAQGLTIVPPSTYLENDVEDKIITYSVEPIATIDYSKLLNTVKLGFISYAVYENWPKEGFRQDAALGFSALLLNAGLSSRDVMWIMGFAIKVAEDGEYEERINAVAGTIEKFQNGIRVSGISLLRTIYDDKFLRYFSSLLGEDLDLAEEYGLFCSRYAWVEDICAIWDVTYKKAVRLGDLKIRYGHLNKHFNTGNSYKTQNIVDTWKESRDKSVYTKIVYEPGKDAIVDNAVNIWGGWGIAPKAYQKSDLLPVLDLIDFLFSIKAQPENKKYRDWFISWLAYPLQNPGRKNHSLVLLYSQHDGVGKGLLSYIIEKIYGDNYVKVTEDIFINNFQDHLLGKQFLLGNEITGAERFKGLDRLKDLVTEPTVTINRKFQAVITIKNCINIMLTTNNFDALWVTKNDRRFFMWEILEAPAVQSFYKEIAEWIDAGGVSYFFQYLLDWDLDAVKYNPMEAPIVTPYKEIAKDLSRTKIDIIVQRACMYPDTTELITASKMLEICLGLGIPPDISVMKIGKTLQKVSGVKRRIFIGLGPQVIWATTNLEKWRKASGPEWLRYCKENPSSYL